MADDAKSNTVIVSVYDQLVVLHMSQPQEYLPFDALSAINVGAKMIGSAVEADRASGHVALEAALLLADHVYDVRQDLKPVGGAAKHELVERHRMKLTQRVALMLNSLREDKTKGNGAVAKTIVDACIAEVFS